jgi:hypothetical protein
MDSIPDEILEMILITCEVNVRQVCHRFKKVMDDGLDNMFDIPLEPHKKSIYRRTYHDVNFKYPIYSVGGTKFAQVVDEIITRSSAKETFEVTYRGVKCSIEYTDIVTNTVTIRSMCSLFECLVSRLLRTFCNVNIRPLIAYISILSGCMIELQRPSYYSSANYGYVRCKGFIISCGKLSNAIRNIMEGSTHEVVDDIVIGNNYTNSSVLSKVLTDVTGRFFDVKNEINADIKIGIHLT